MKPPRLLLVVQDTFFIAGRGLIVAPDLDLGQGFQQRFVVELRRPDRTTLQAEVIAEVPFIVPLNPEEPRWLRHMLHFPGLTKVEVPIGTEVWTIDQS